MSLNSRIPGFHRLSPEERRRTLAERLGVPIEDLSAALDQGGLPPEAADRLVENVIGTFALPFAVAPNFRINGRDVFVPMVVEEPSVVAAAAHAARMVREGGGFLVECDPSHMVAQVQVFTSDPEAAAARILAARDEVLSLASRADPTLVEVGGGPVDLEVRILRDDRGEPFVVVHLVVDVGDAMGANAVNTMAEAVAPRLSDLAGGPYGLRILTNLADRRCVRVRARVPARALDPPDGTTPGDLAAGIAAASRFADLDPYRAATHNKGILNGTDAVVVATGNDWRAVEAGAHAFAAREGRYRPLCTWQEGAGTLDGFLEMPLAVGVVGGATRRHAGARLALRLLGAGHASDVAAAAAAAGMANNLAALRALVTEGIQRGHMRLAARARSGPDVTASSE